MATFRLLAAILALACSALTSTLAQAQLADPWKDWLSADSAHFRVHYRAEHRAQAQRAIQAAESAYPRITSMLQWEPRSRTEIVLFNEFDLPNGFATPLPFNMIGVFLAPDNDGQLLDNSTWLDLLLTHEFTHVVHLDKVRGAPKALRVYSETLRTKRRQRAEEAAAKTGVKMVFPLVTCIFPAIWVITIGPAAIKFVTVLFPMVENVR